MLLTLQIWLFLSVPRKKKKNFFWATAHNMSLCKQFVKVTWTALWAAQENSITDVFWASKNSTLLINQTSWKDVVLILTCKNKYVRDGCIRTVVVYLRVKKKIRAYLQCMHSLSPCELSKGNICMYFWFGSKMQINTCLSTKCFSVSHNRRDMLVFLLPFHRGTYNSDLPTCSIWTQK